MADAAASGSPLADRFKALGKTLLHGPDGIVGAAFNFADHAPIEYGRKLYRFFEDNMMGMGFYINPAQEAWLQLLKAHGENDDGGVQMALQSIVTIVADECDCGAVLVPTVPTPSDDATDDNLEEDVPENPQEPVEEPKTKRRKINTFKIGRRKDGRQTKGAMQGAKTVEVKNPRGPRMVSNQQEAAANPGAAVKASYYDRRIAIKYLYEDMDCPSKGEWHGKDGTIKYIQSRLNIPDPRSVQKVLSDIDDCQRKGLEYTGKYNSANMGKPVILEIDSVEANIIADSLEAGLSFRKAHLKVNYYRTQEGNPDLVSYSAVVGCYNRMAKDVYHAEKQGSGSTNHQAVWAVARYRWVKQLLIRLGIIVYDGNDGMWEENQAINVEGQQSPPDYFNVEKLGRIEKSQIGWWDETHTKVIIGFFNLGRTTRVVQFYRGADGKVLGKGDERKGELSDEVAIMTMKFPGEVRMSLGCAAVEKMKGGEWVEEGVRANMFDYSECTLVTIKREREMLKLAIESAKTSKDKKWIKVNRPEDSLYTEDKIFHLPKIGEKGKRLEMLKEAGFTKVGDFATLSDDDVKARAAEWRGVSVKMINDWREQAQAATEGEAPKNTDYRDGSIDPNPYKALYGDEWEKKIWKESPWHKGFCSVKDLVTHIVVETANMFEGTKHEDDFLFFHDALSQMTSKETIAWMKSQMFRGKSYYDRWILPKFGLNSDNSIIDGLSRYDGRPVGNSPAFMPWDNSLNKDIDDDVLWHVLLTDSLKKGDDGKYPAAKFSLDTPTLGAEAYRRRIDPSILPLGSPKPCRIVQDVDKAIAAFGTVYERGGVKCPELANANGHRRTLAGNWGGPRVKTAAATILEEMQERMDNVDEDVKKVLDEDLEKVKKRVEAATLNLPEGDLEADGQTASN